jgi:hypothetical protein
VTAPTASSAATDATTPQAAAPIGPAAGASQRKAARNASVPRLPRGTAAAIRRAAAGPASAWVATSRAVVAAGNGTSSPAQPGPTAPRTAATVIRHAAGASDPDSLPRPGRSTSRHSAPPAARRFARRSAAMIAAAAIANLPSGPTSGSPPSPAATAA